VWLTGCNDQRTQLAYIVQGYAELFLGKTVIQPCSTEMPHPYVARSSLYYPWFAVSHFVIFLGYIYIYVCFTDILHC